MTNSPKWAAPRFVSSRTTYVFEASSLERLSAACWRRCAKSPTHPLTILSGLPSAAFGALVTLILFRMDLNIYAFVGMIMLIGIVEKNAIMQIDFALEAERGGKTPEAAIYEGCLIRFRPIMMTTMAALLGAVPIAVGLLFSKLVTLYLTPVVYTNMAQLQTWIRARQGTRDLRPITAK
jgi:HAE1 family hydrophobic/amphiphilic exporter-1